MTTISSNIIQRIIEIDNKEKGLEVTKNRILSYIFDNNSEDKNNNIFERIFTGNISLPKGKNSDLIEDVEAINFYLKLSNSSRNGEMLVLNKESREQVVSEAYDQPDKDNPKNDLWMEIANSINHFRVKNNIAITYRDKLEKPEASQLESQKHLSTAVPAFSKGNSPQR